MVRVTVKGGLWRNSEDEVLKAAVMKYGLNQWARISSLLVRKSASQCKARWFDWLDPSIKKIDWSIDEDEKLLHLAKVLPSQWRTIAPMINRTPAQCIQRYEELLEQAAREQDQSSQSSNQTEDTESRRFKDIQFDMAPETKPARPDSVDMDGDEKEMLNEARARLANTKGKKAKRQERERALEEARLVAERQKQREMLAAGIEPKKKRNKRKEMDYNEEIPFEQRPPTSMLDTSEEDARARNLSLQKAFKPITLQEFEGIKKPVNRAVEERKQQKKLELEKEYHLPDVINKQSNNQASNQAIAKRIKVSLPEPSFSDADLQEIVSNQQSTPQSNLQSLIRSRTTQHMPLVQDSISQSIKRHLYDSTASTPLLGGDNMPMLDSDSQSNLSSASFTPAPLDQISGVRPNSQTPRSNKSDNHPTAHSTKRSSKPSLFSNIFTALPAPKNEYALNLIPESNDDKQPIESPDQPMDDDVEEVEYAVSQMNAATRARLLDCESQAVQKQLPRPLPPVYADTRPINQSINQLDKQIHEMIDAEFRRLVDHDALVHNDDADQSDPSPLVDLQHELLVKARELIDEESKINLIDHSNDVIIIDRARESIKQTLDQSVDLDEVRAFHAALTELSDSCAADVAEKLAPSLAINQSINQSICTAEIEYHKQQIQLECFTAMLQREEAAAQHRTERAEAELAEVQQAEAKLQAEYQTRLIQQKLRAATT